MLEKLKIYMPWILRAAEIAVIIVLAYSWNAARSARDALAKELEGEKLDKAGLIRERDASRKDLAAAEKNIVDHDEIFKAEREKLWKALDEKPKVITVTEWHTLPGSTVPPVGPPEAPRPDVCGDDGKPKKEILLVDGDKMHIEVSEATYETKADNHVLLATASCWRDTPTLRKLYAGGIEAPVTTALKLPEAPKYGWGAGINTMATSDKLGFGPDILFPQWEVFGLQLDARAGAAFGSAGFVGASVAAGVRWK